MLKQGFTLIELLIAMAIFSLLSLGTYAGLNQVLLVERNLDTHNARLSMMQKAVTVIERDLIQIARRPVRNETGNLEPALSLNTERMEFTRLGRINLSGIPQSNLWRIGYFKLSDKLVRKAWPTLDRALNTQPFEDLLIEDLEQFDIKVLWKNKWYDQWPEQDSEKKETSKINEIPDAIQVTLKISQFPEITRTITIENAKIIK